MSLREGALQDQSKLGLGFDLWRALGKLGPDVVLVPGYSSFAALVAAVWARTHSAVSIMMSESNHDDHVRNPAKESLKRRLVRALFDAAVVGGVRAGAYAESLLGLPSEHIAYGVDVVDNEFFRIHAERLRAVASAKDNGLPLKYFVCVARLSPEKNLAELIRAFAAYRLAGGTWDLIIVGRGSLEEELRSLAIQTGVQSQVHFAGFKNGIDLIVMYAFATCFVLASTREPWGLVVNEAMASHLPVIVSSRCGCVDNLVEHGVNGFVFDPLSTDELCCCLLQMEAMPEADREAMGRRSEAIISRYTPQECANEIARLLLRIGSPDHRKAATD
jgi:glycosyltransferase involved in cell wall biosynthesis